MKVLAILFFIAFASSMEAVTLITSPAHLSRPANSAVASALAVSSSKWSASLTWHERLGVFLLKHHLRQEEKRQGAHPQTVNKNDSKAITALILGIVSIFFAGIILGTLAIIFGITALRRIKRDPDMYGGRNMATAGIICGIVGIIGAIIFLIILANRA